jgi:Mlc titration factor MtfA (ptsG expression regulator)
MDIQALSFSIFTLAALTFAAALLSFPRWVEFRRRRLLRNAFPAAWRKILRQRVPLVRRLPVDLQLQLKKHIQVFIAEKAFIGCAGLRITEEMRVVIAAQACLLLLNRRTGYYPNLRQVLVYPGAFLVDRLSTDGSGVQQERRQVLIGESWTQGQIILSWQDCLEGAAVPDDGRNVVIHEFAHQLDQENGPANGAPSPNPGDVSHNHNRWAAVFAQAYAQLQAEAASGFTGLLNHYGAKDPAEFFAVVSEVFFEQPAQLEQDYPDVYRELVGFYQVEPTRW